MTRDMRHSRARRSISAMARRSPDGREPGNNRGSGEYPMAAYPGANGRFELFSDNGTTYGL